MPSRLTTIASFENPAEAHLARARLENEGIAAVVTGEATASWLWYYGTAIGGAQLQVFEEDAPQAREVLGKIHQVPRQPAPVADDGAEQDAESEAEDPEQQALEATVRRAWRAAVLGIVLGPVAVAFTVYSMVEHIDLAAWWYAYPVVMIFNIYSMWLLLQVMSSGRELPPRAQATYWSAWGVNALAVLLSAAVVARFLMDP